MAQRTQRGSEQAAAKNAIHSFQKISFAETEPTEMRDRINGTKRAEDCDAPVSTGVMPGGC
jgi:hypothetical protein